MSLIHFKMHRSRLSAELLLAQCDRDHQQCQRILGEIGRITSIIRSYEDQVHGLVPDEVQTELVAFEDRP